MFCYMRRKIIYLIIIPGLFICILGSIYLYKTYIKKPQKIINYMSKTEYFYDMEPIYRGYFLNGHSNLTIKSSKLNDSVYQCNFNEFELDEVHLSNCYIYFTLSKYGNLASINRFDSFPMKTYGWF